MTSEALDTALRTIPGQCKVVDKSHPNSPNWLGLHVEDQVGTVVLVVQCHPSNSGSTLVLNAGGTTYLRQWDEVKVASMIVSGFYLTASSKPRKTWPATIHKDLRTGPWPRAELPPVVSELLRKVHAHYLKCQGEDVRMAIERVKQELGFLKEHVSEEDVLRWYREAVVQDVLQS